MSGILGMIFGLLGVLLKLAFYAILAGVIAYYVYMYREEIKAAWQKLLAELKALWERWFGRQHSAANEVILAEFAPTIHPFAAYADPFATGQATRMKPVELVRYTFDALQAWGLEHDCPRQENETPHEYVERLGVFAPQIANESLRLADYYGLAAYAGGKLPAQSVEAVRALWQKLADSAVLV